MIDWIYPRRCPICEEIISAKKDGLLCRECGSKLIKIEEPICFKCGQPTDSREEEYCYDCSRKSHEFVGGRAVWVYNTAIRQSLYRFKYGNRREYAEFYGEQISEHLGKWILSLEVDAVIPIPLHWRRQRKRGYNQAELIAEKVALGLNIPLRTKHLKRRKNTSPQKVLNDKDRKNNLKNAFKIRCDGLQLKKVLLIDDIYTTGSTMDAAARVLKESGVSEVYFVSASIGRGY